MSNIGVGQGRKASVGSAFASLLLMLCLACSVQLPQTCQNCNAGIPATGGSEQSFDFFNDQVLGPGTWTSNPFPRLGNNIVVEAILASGANPSATATLLDAPLGGSLTQATDSAAPGPPLTTYTKWMVRGVLGTVGLKVVITSGAWMFRGTWTNETSTVARAAYYDRNVSNPTAYKGFSLTPPTPGFVVGWSYTVPVGRKALIDLAGAAIVRQIAATTASQVGADVFYTPAATSLTVAVASAHIDFNNTVGASVSSLVPGIGAMVAGDVLKGEAEDLSTGGSVNASAWAKLLEFDA